ANVELSPAVVQAPAKQPAPAPQPRPGRIIVSKNFRLGHLIPEGSDIRWIEEPPAAGEWARHHPLSPDGKRLACEAIVQAPPTGPAIFVWDLDKPWPGDVKLDIWGQEWFWAPDGKGLVVVVYDLDGGEVRGYRQRLIDIATRQTTELAVPAGHRILDWSPD